MAILASIRHRVPGHIDAPSAIWRARILLNGLSDPGLAAALKPDGLLGLQLRQEIEPAGGGTPRIETTARMGAGG